VAQSTERLFALLEMMQSGGTHSLAELAQRLDVDKRTVRRYVEQLRQLDIAVETVRGRYGGYRLAPHYRMPPLMLNDDEAVAVIWSLLATAKSGFGPASETAFASATAKLRRVLPVPLRERLDAMERTVAFADADDTPTTARGDIGGAALLLEVASAARDRQPVTFGYTSGDGTTSQRTVQPRGIVAHRGKLYLAGYDTERQGPRTFRLDRMSQPTRTRGTFAPTPMSAVLDQVMGPLAPSSGRHDVSVVIAAAPEHVREFMPRLLASVTPAPEPAGYAGPAGLGSVARSTRLAPDGWVRVEVQAERLDWVARRIAAIDRPFVVERPLELYDSITGLAQRLSGATHHARRDEERPRRPGGSLNEPSVE
jgi:predicted DNA-binding transcriptional regulator YafY